MVRGVPSVLLASVLALAVVGCTSAPGPTPTPAGPTPGPTIAGPTSSEAPSATAQPSVASEVTDAPPTQETATGEPSLAPGTTATPSVDTLAVKRTADCTRDNGTGTVGMIRLTWTSTGTTGIRVSIDPPSPDKAYGSGFADYPTASGFADVPFACGAPNHDATGDYHLYVVTTLHTSGYAAYRYAKVYEVAPAATP